ncbi:MAG: permease-like cell division protein FtsX, partial [Duncaniella sp.]|nr:permease-like cell division protein FtsX [Duncaniella sp.]
MDKKVRNPIPVFTTRATAVVTVALVLIILGLGAFIGLGARNAAVSVRDSMGFVVILSDDATAGDIDQIISPIKSSGALRQSRYSSADEVLKRWQQMLGDEDILRMAGGVNPFHPELEIYLNQPFANPDSINTLADPISLLPCVEDVEIHSRVMQKVSQALATVRLILTIVGISLLIISFVLIFNTVRLTVYSKRFLINTMQLVGATAAYVRRPFLVDNLINGVVAGLIASAILCGAYAYLASVDAVLAALADWTSVGIVCCGLVVVGML